MTSDSELQKRHGASVKKAVTLRLAELENASNLAVMGKIRVAGFHSLKGDRKGRFAVKVPDGKRIVFSPANAPLKEDGGLDLDRVTEIVIEELVNYHGQRKHR